MEKDFASLWKVEPLLGADVAMLLISTLGFLINLVLLHITRMYRGVAQAIDTTLIQIIAVFDCLASMFMISSLVLRGMFGNGILVNNGLWCRLSAVIFSGSTLVTLVFTALLALARYLAIVRSKRINNTRFFICAYLIMGMIFLMFISLAFSYNAVVPPSGLYCTPRFAGPKLGVRLGGYVTLGLLMFSLFTIPMCYFGVTLHYQQLIRRMGGAKKYHSVWRIQRSTYTLLLVAISYAITTFPEFIVVTLSVTRVIRRTSLADGIVICLLTTTTILNALFSLIMHDEIHSRFLSFIGVSVGRLDQP